MEAPTLRPPTKDLSVVLACYNGGPRLEDNILQLNEFLKKLGRSFELLVVEDGSVDDSLAVLRRLETQLPTLSVLRNPANMGKGFSVRNGVLNSSGKYIIFTDLDMAYAPENIHTLLEKLEGGCAMVVANRRAEQSVYTVNNRLVRYVYRRHRTGLLFNFLVRMLYGIQHRDTQSGLKGFERTVATQVFETLHTNGFLFDVEIFLRAKKLGVTMGEIPVHLTYTSDESTVKQLRYFFQLVPELVRIKYLELRGAYDPK